MSVVILYEIAGVHKSSYLNAVELLSLDSSRELFLSDVLEYFNRSPIGCNFMFYALIRDRLVWLESPSSLVPVCPDGVIRLLLKPSTFPPLIHPKQCFDFADKSRVQFYTRSDYDRTSEFAYRTFDETGRAIEQWKRENAARKKADSSRATATQSAWSGNAATGSNREQFGQQDSNQHDDFADFDRNFAERRTDGRPPTGDRRPTTTSYSDRPERYSEQLGTEKRQAEMRRLPSNRPYSTPYNLDHPHKGKDKDKEHEGGLNSIVGEETAAVLSDAVEAAGVAAKSLFSFATSLGKSVMDIAQTGTAQTAAALGAGGPPSKLREGSVVQVGRMAVSVTGEIAEGGFGMVYAVEDCSRGQRYALKQLLCQSREQVNEANNELEVLKRFSGRSNGTIIELLEYTAAESHQKSGAHPMKQVLMLFPLYPAGTLWDRIADASESHVRSWPFPEPTALYLVLCAAEALQVLHRDGLAHRDVKPHNFLLEEIPQQAQAMRGIPSAYRPVLTDLGSVTEARFQVRTKREALNLEEEAASKTSAAYRSPELTSPPFPPFQIDERVDTWGLGCTMYCIAFGRSPFETPREGVLRLAILNGKYSLPAGNRNKDCVFSEEFVELIDRMLRVDISERPYVEEIIRTCEDLLTKYT